MKLYTRQGDTGGTSLFGGQRVEKTHLRVEAYGTIDELNSTLGLAAVTADARHIQPLLAELQIELFELGTAICTPPDRSVGHVPPLTESHVERLEGHIDRLTESLEPMRHFILPGGCETAARLHVARTVCRRAERRLTALHAAEPIAPVLLAYVNRLSDLLFVLARYANHLAGVEDVAWKP